MQTFSKQLIIPEALSVEEKSRTKNYINYCTILSIFIKFPGSQGCIIIKFFK